MASTPLDPEAPTFSPESDDGPPALPDLALNFKLSPGPNITQHDILSLPIPQPPLVQAEEGSCALWPISTYNFDKHRTERSLCVVHFPTTQGDEPSQSRVLVKKGMDNFEVAWLDTCTWAFLRPVVPGGVEVETDRNGNRIDQGEGIDDDEYAKVKEEWKGKADGTEVWTRDVNSGEETKVGTLPVSISSIRVRQESPTSVILAFCATVYPDGSIYTVKSQEAKFATAKKRSDIRVYDSAFVRRWDEWMPLDGEIKQVHFVRLNRDKEGQYSFETEKQKDEAGAETSRPKVVSPLAGTKLECLDYSISSTHLAFHAKDPELNPAFHSRTDVYLVPLGTGQLKKISPGTQGATACPILSDDGTKLAWLEMRQDKNEADRNRIMVHSIESGKTRGLTEEWDRSPGRIEWSRDGSKLYATTDELGHVKLYEIGLEGNEPKKLTDKHSVSSVSPLPNGQILVSINSFTSPNSLHLVNPFASTDEGTVAEPVPVEGGNVTRDLLRSKVLHKGESFWFKSPDNEKVQGWILFPPSHPKCSKDSAKTKQAEPKSYPLVHLTTGGPQSQATDGWMERWHFNAHAAKGYITIVINRTGSTGFGQDFCDRIQGDWAGAPFRDLVAGVAHVKEHYPEVDPERMATSGGSYGGFMQNWIEGHNEEFGFKCIINFQGIFSSTQIWYSTEELYFTTQEYGGYPWEVPENYNKFNPQNHIKKWKTPMLVIHNSKDYRVVDTEGLGVFNTLQALKIPSRFITFPSENHWDLSPANNIAWHEEVFKWMSHWTKTKDAC